jgi:hypothetical protein
VRNIPSHPQVKVRVGGAELNAFLPSAPAKVSRRERLDERG